MFKVMKTHIDGVIVLEPDVFGDERGFFLETFNKKNFEKIGLNYNFVQDNCSKSSKGVLRGLHFQVHHPQTKCARALYGEVYDVAVDLRANSPTYGQYFGTVLSENNKRIMITPKGCAHGVLTLSDWAIFEYKCDDYYHPDDEDGIAWDDPDINIEWPFSGKIILSEKDKNRKKIKDNKVELLK